MLTRALSLQLAGVARASTACVAIGLAFAGCSSDSHDRVPDHHGSDGDDGPVGTVASALVDSDTVDAAVADSACTTALVKKLSVQLIEELECLAPNSMERIDKVPNLSLGAAVIPYLQKPAAEALKKVIASRGVTLSTNSALRALPQQYMLYRWSTSKPKRCNIGLAASPGTSNHESALAMDVNDYAAWKPAFEKNGWKWLGAADEVHFDYVAGGVNIKGLSVKAFQRLWNRNNPNDKIDEDGDYGPSTESRLAKSPIGGFPIGAKCDLPPDGGAPDAAAPMTPTDTPSTPDATEPSTDVDAGSTSVSAQPSAEGFAPGAEGADESGCSVHASPVHSLEGLALGGIALLVARRRRRTR